MKNTINETKDYKTNLHKNRVRRYFVDSAMEILRGEGFSALSVRNISLRAGYSSASFYNHFEDMGELIFMCLKEFAQECKNMLSSAIKSNTDSLERIKIICLEFVKYFVQYPGIFELFYTSNIINLRNNKNSLELIHNLLKDVLEKDFNDLLIRGIFTKTEIDNKKIQIEVSLIGLLLLYINRCYPVKYSDFNTTLINQIDSCLYPCLVNN